MPGLTLDGLSQLLQQDAYPHYKIWCQGKRVTTTGSTFTALRFGRESWQHYPELASCYKGAMVKFMMYWTACFLNEKLTKDCSPRARLRAFVAFALAQFQYLQDSHGPWFPDKAANQAYHVGRTFLLLYQRLAVDSRKSCPTRKLYKLIPKFHSFLHMCISIQDTKRNPRYEHLYMEEDYMKHISKICSRCHPATMDRVCLYRYRALIELCGSDL